MQLPATIDSNSVGGEFGGSVDFTATRIVVASEKGGYHYHQNIDNDTNYKQCKEGKKKATGLNGVHCKPAAYIVVRNQRQPSGRHCLRYGVTPKSP